MSSCNYCTHQRILKEAAAHGATAVVTPDPLTDVMQGGVRVMVDGVFKAWFGALPDRCHCDDD